LIGQDAVALGDVVADARAQGKSTDCTAIHVESLVGEHVELSGLGEESCLRSDYEFVHVYVYVHVHVHVHVYVYDYVTITTTRCRVRALVFQ
jgi:hypothetical protein